MVAFAICSTDVLLFSTLIRNCVVEIDSIYNLSTLVLDGSCEYPSEYQTSLNVRNET